MDMCVGWRVFPERRSSVLVRACSFLAGVFWGLLHGCLELVLSQSSRFIEIRFVPHTTAQTPTIIFEDHVSPPGCRYMLRILQLHDMPPMVKSSVMVPSRIFRRTEHTYKCSRT